MESAATLEGTGMPGLQAQAVGQTIATIAGTGTTQPAGAAIGTATIVLGTTTTSQTAFVLPAGMPAGHEILVYCFSTTTALVFPDTLSTIDAGTPTTGSVSVATKVARRFIRTGVTTWISMLTA